MWCRSQKYVSADGSGEDLLYDDKKYGHKFENLHD